MNVLDHIFCFGNIFIREDGPCYACCRGCSLIFYSQGNGLVEYDVVMDPDLIYCGCIRIDRRQICDESRVVRDFAEKTFDLYGTSGFNDCLTSEIGLGVSDGKDHGDNYDSR